MSATKTKSEPKSKADDPKPEPVPAATTSTSIRYTEDELMAQLQAAEKAKGAKLSVIDLAEKKYGLSASMPTFMNRLGGMNKINAALGYDVPAQQRKKNTAKMGKPTAADALKVKMHTHDQLVDLSRMMPHMQDIFTGIITDRKSVV